MTHRFLRISVIENMSGLSLSRIYLRIPEKRFPKPNKLVERAVAWLESDINPWMEQQIKSSQHKVKSV